MVARRNKSPILCYLTPHKLQKKKKMILKHQGKIKKILLALANTCIIKTISEFIFTRYEKNSRGWIVAGLHFLAAGENAKSFASVESHTLTI